MAVPVRRGLALLVVVALGLLALAACSGAGGEASVSPGGASSGPGAASVSPGGASSGPTGVASSVPPTRSGRATARPTTSTVAAGWWHPTKGLTWQWQLSGPLDLSVPAQVYDVDLFDTSAAQVSALHAAGRKVICYLDAGSYEPGRPDSAAFPAAVLGAPVEGWPGERWLDIRRLDLLAPIMAARMDLCRSKGFDAVEADNVDGYANNSGFPLTAADQLRYNRWLAGLAHSRALAIGLKNDLDQVAALQPSFDFAVNEQCVQYNECDALVPFLAAGKPVFHAEYELTTAQFCPTARRLGLSSIRKTLDLSAWRQTC